MRSFARFSIAAALAVIGISGATPAFAAAPKFTITQTDDRFSADGKTTYSSDGNRISKKSIAGGRHIDRKGVYLNPTAVVTRATGKVEMVALDLMNMTERYSIEGAPNAIGRPLRVSFITGEGTPIVLEIANGHQDIGQTECSRISGCTTPIIEAGVAIITLDQYRRLMAATALAIKIDGTDRDHVYEMGDIEASFIPNLTAFYNAHLAGQQ